jgi:hypothetical protein
MGSDHHERGAVGQPDALAGLDVGQVSGRVGARPQLDDPHVVVERGREVHGDACCAPDTVDGGRKCRGVVHDQQVAGREVIAEVGESAVRDASRRGDHQLDAVTGDTVCLGRLNGIQCRRAFEMRARLRESHVSAPSGNKSCAL